MVRVNAKIAGAAATAAQQTYVITGKAPTIDIGSARVGPTFDENVHATTSPSGAPTATSSSGRPARSSTAAATSRSAARPASRTSTSSTAMNVTGLRYGNLESGAATIGGGSNLPLEFLTQIDVNSGGYQAEYGGAMGGVINTVLKSGSNEFHGSAFGYWSPYWLSGNPNPCLPVAAPLAGVRKPRLRRQHRRRGRRPDHQGQAVLLGRLRAPHHRHPRPAPDLRAARGIDSMGNPRRRPPSTPTGSRSSTSSRLDGAHPRDAPDLLLRRDARLAPAARQQADPQHRRHAQLQPGARRASTESTARLRPPDGRRVLDPGQHRRGRALGLQAARPPLADRRPRRHAQRVSLRPLAVLRAQQPEPAPVRRREPLGPGARARLPARRHDRLPALPGEPVLPVRRLRRDRQVHRLSLDGRGQVDAHLRGRRPQRAQVRLAPRSGDPRPSALLFGPGRQPRLFADLLPRQPERSARNLYNTTTLFGLMPG